MRTLTRWEPFRGATTLQDQVNRLFNDVLERTGEESSLTAWAPSVDIYETEHELVVKADLPEVDPKDLDIRVENNILTIRGERKFEKNVNQDNYLRVERAYGSFARSFTLANTVNSEAIKADYQNGVLTLSIPKKRKPSQSRSRSTSGLRRWPRLPPEGNAGRAPQWSGKLWAGESASPFFYEGGRKRGCYAAIWKNDRQGARGRASCAGRRRAPRKSADRAGSSAGRTGGTGRWRGAAASRASGSPQRSPIAGN